MANIKHFSDYQGATHALVILSDMPNKEFALRFPGVRGIRSDGFTMRVGYAAGATMDGQELPVTRCIEYKAFPSRHECNAKCMGGKVNGTCECKCGGKNHGAGMFTALVAEAA